MNILLKQSIAVLVEANVHFHFSRRKVISSKAAPAITSTFSSSDKGGWRKQVKNILTTVNTRDISTSCGNCGETKSSPKDDILKSWTKSIVSRSGGENLPELNTLKRPPVATLKKGVDVNLGKESLPPKGTVKFRRRLVDKSWTATPMDEKIIWVDCEMTGLDPQKDLLIEIGVIITDAELNVIDVHDSIVFHAEDSVLDGMDPWCIKHHGESGLISACKSSKVTHAIADEDLVKFLEKHTVKGECPMAGNSIGQDRGFIRRQLPKFHSHFHYRDIDVSSIKELVRRWYPDVFAAAPRKKGAHRVLDDINDSIEELKYYRSSVFTSPK